MEDKKEFEIPPFQVVVQFAVLKGRDAEVTDKTTFVWHGKEYSFGSCLEGLPPKQEKALRNQLNRVGDGMRARRNMKKENAVSILGFKLPDFKF